MTRQRMNTIREMRKASVMIDREISLLILLGMAILGLIRRAWLWISEVFCDD